MVIKYNMGKNEYRNWIVGETDFQPEYLGKYETIFTLSNGYMGVRATTEETYREETRGCYIAGLFDKFPGEVTELANIPSLKCCTPLLVVCPLIPEQISISPE